METLFFNISPYYITRTRLSSAPQQIFPDQARIEKQEYVWPFY